MHDFNQIGEELDRILRVRTTPLGLKYFEDENDLPEAFEKIEQQITICQLIGMARYHEKAVYTTGDLATACAAGGALQGFLTFQRIWSTEPGAPVGLQRTWRRPERSSQTGCP